MRAIARDLEEDGIVVMSRWLLSDGPLSRVDLQDGSAARFAAMDFEDLRGSNACIAFTEPPDSEVQGRGGRHVELGIAFGLDIPVLLVGPPEHVFHALPSLHRATDWSTARQLIRSGALAVEGPDSAQRAA